MSWLDYLTWPRAAISNLQADVAAIRVAVLLETPRRLRTLERLIMATAEELVSALNIATDEVARDLATLRADLAAAIADKDQAVQDAVNSALAGFDAPIARLQALGADPSDPVPAPEPTPEPTPGPAPVDPAPVDPEPVA